MELIYNNEYISIFIITIICFIKQGCTKVPGRVKDFMVEKLD